MGILLILPLIVIGFVGFIAFAILNIWAVNKSNAELRNLKPAVIYKPVPVKKEEVQKMPAPTPVPAEPKKQYLTVQEFVKKNLNLIDKLLQDGKTFTLSDEILKDLDEEGRIGLADWFSNMDKVKDVRIAGEYKIFM